MTLETQGLSIPLCGLGRGLVNWLTILIGWPFGQENRFIEDI